MRTSAIILQIVILMGACETTTVPEPECESPDFNLAVLDVVGAECGVPGGTIVASAGGAPGMVSYSLDDGKFQDSGIFNAVKPGIHIVTARLDRYCVLTASVTVTSGISFQETIKPIIEANCAIDGCHDGSGSINFLNFDNIKSNPADIKSRTQSGNMPKNGKLTQDEIDKIACWVDDGALYN